MQHAKILAWTLPPPADGQAAFCATVVDEWVRAGVTDAVVAPGSRNTPMIVALHRDGRLRIHVVLDERSAGFVAVGIGSATGRPAAVVTTSGTASVELHPAVVEASYAGVPLLAVTADRPPELQGVGAPQTVDQDGLFGRTVRWSTSPGVADGADSGWWRSLASRAVAEAVSGPGGPGPVHLNLAFREPLIGTGGSPPVPTSRESGRPWHRTGVLDAGRRVAGFGGVAGVGGGADLPVSPSGRGLVVVGAGGGDPDAVLAEAARLGWPVLADPRSGARRPGGPVVAAADALLRQPEVAGWHPDLVVRAGAPWASKVLSQWLAGLDPAVPQILADPFGRWADPERRATDVVAADPDQVIAAAGAGAPIDLTWRDRWLGAEAAAQAALDAALAPGGRWALSEPAVARAVVAGLPDGADLFASSSMPVRDIEWYGGVRSGLRVLANRGANGIDGVVSTAIGAAIGSDRPTLALVGDLAFLYDAGALLWAARRPVSLTVVVVDNRGGGIFSFLPQATALAPAEFERYWGTPHGVDLGAVAAAYGIDVDVIGDRAALDRVISEVGRPGIRVAVVTSDRAANVEVHDALHRAVGTAVGLRAGPGRRAGPAA